MSTCPNCGAERSDRYRFCQHCGSPRSAAGTPSDSSAGHMQEPGPAPNPDINRDPVARFEDWTLKAAEQLRDQVDRGVLGDIWMNEGTVVEIKRGTDWKSGGFSRGYSPKEIFEITYRLKDETTTAMQVDAIRGPLLSPGDEIRVHYRVKGWSVLVWAIENFTRASYWKAKKRIL